MDGSYPIWGKSDADRHSKINKFDFQHQISFRQNLGQGHLLKTLYDGRDLGLTRTSGVRYRCTKFEIKVAAEEASWIGPYISTIFTMVMHYILRMASRFIILSSFTISDGKLSDKPER